MEYEDKATDKRNFLGEIEGLIGKSPLKRSGVVKMNRDKKLQKQGEN